MSFTITDLTLFCLFILYFWTGWRTGMLRSLIGPLSFALSTLAAIIHFDLNNNVLAALSIIIGGSLGLSILGRFILFLMQLSVKEEDRDFVFIGSRITGSVLSLAWKGTITLMFLIVLTVLPKNTFGLGEVQDNITQSTTYAIINATLIGRNDQARRAVALLKVSKDPQILQQISDMPETSHLLANPKIKILTSDPEISELIENEDYIQLLRHKKVREVAADRALMRGLATLGKRLIEEDPETIKPAQPAPATTPASLANTEF